MKLARNLGMIATNVSGDMFPHEAEASEVLGIRDSTFAQPDLELTPGVEDTHDPVRTYLREMGTVRLLTREGEVALAKRIERGEIVVAKAVSRSPFVIAELITLGNDLRRGARSAKEISQIASEDPSQEKSEAKRLLRTIVKIAKLYSLANKQAAALKRTRKPRSGSQMRARYRLARTRVSHLWRERA